MHSDGYHTQSAGLGAPTASQRSGVRRFAAGCAAYRMHAGEPCWTGRVVRWSECWLCQVGVGLGVGGAAPEWRGPLCCACSTASPLPHRFKACAVALRQRRWLPGGAKPAHPGSGMHWKTWVMRCICQVQCISRRISMHGPTQVHSQCRRSLLPLGPASLAVMCARFRGLLPQAGRRRYLILAGVAFPLPDPPCPIMNRSCLHSITRPSFAEPSGR